MTGVPQPPGPPRTWDEYARQLATNLQTRRHAAGLTQEQLAHKAGITRNHYQLLERGYWRRGSPSNPRLSVILRLATALDLDIAALLPPGNQIDW